jgi:hypothetical protein
VSRYKFYRSREFIPGYKADGGHWRSVAPRPVRAKRVTGVQTISEPENYHGAGFQLRADARVWVQRSLQFVLGAGAKAKSVTNNLPILSVLAAVFLF